MIAFNWLIGRSNLKSESLVVELNFRLILFFEFSFLVFSVLSPPVIRCHLYGRVSPMTTRPKQHLEAVMIHCDNSLTLQIISILVSFFNLYLILLNRSEPDRLIHWLVLVCMCLFDLLVFIRNFFFEFLKWLTSSFFLLLLLWYFQDTIDSVFLVNIEFFFFSFFLFLSKQ